MAIPEEIVSRKRESVEEIDNVLTRCVQNHQLYLEKIKLRKQEATIVESEKEVTYESLGKIDKEAFDTYRKYLKVDAKFNAWFM